jgi:hypothetical protein
VGVTNDKKEDVINKNNNKLYEYGHKNLNMLEERAANEARGAEDNNGTTTRGNATGRPSSFD